ncbi:hypothetical protein EX30DRAFT_31785 [Ascodesmis nigricans]|uniref:Uncharacterized protein n=1 Tax=Ascodesmis nigricans TaxID=341454 RepID=A0A4S2N934_9PEZI|nr:hypothetical protein EX30DRAFT_31785 [Ascodesmis nigricans]
MSDQKLAAIRQCPGPPHGLEFLLFRVSLIWSGDVPRVERTRATKSLYLRRLCFLGWFGRFSYGDLGYLYCLQCVRSGYFCTYVFSWVSLVSLDLCWISLHILLFNFGWPVWRCVGTMGCWCALCFFYLVLVSKSNADDCVNRNTIE